MKVLNNIPSSGFVFLVGIFLFTLIFRIAYSTPIEFEEDTLGENINRGSDSGNGRLE